MQYSFPLPLILKLPSIFYRKNAFHLGRLKKKQFLFLFILFNACSNPPEQSKITSDFFANHANKVWVSNLRLLGEYQAIRFEANQGNDAEHFYTYFINSGQRECLTPILGDNFGSISQAEGETVCSNTRYEITINRANQLEFKVIHYNNDQNCDNISIIRTEKHSYRVNEELMSFQRRNEEENTSTSQAFYLYSDNFSSCFN